MRGETPGELHSLAHAAFIKRHVRALQNARRIAVGLTMTHQQNRHAAFLSRLVTSANALTCRLIPIAQSSRTACPVATARSMAYVVLRLSMACSAVVWICPARPVERKSSQERVSLPSGPQKSPIAQSPAVLLPRNAISTEWPGT